MRFLFHCAVGNTDRPERWKFINKNFINMANSLVSLGHQSVMWINPRAKVSENDSMAFPAYYDLKVNKQRIEQIKPDYIITWNGNSDGDKEVIKHFDKNKIIYGELGYFRKNSKSCYFDRCGVNSVMSNLIEPIDAAWYDEALYNSILDLYRKPPKEVEPFIFVPLQDETDTQIRIHSSYNSMEHFMQHVDELFRHDSRKILFKKHPLAPCNILNRWDKYQEVNDDVNQYLQYADLVVGINGTCLLETLLFHDNVLALGAGIASRHFESDIHKKAFLCNLYNKQVEFNNLSDPEVIANYPLFKEILNG